SALFADRLLFHCWFFNSVAGSQRQFDGDHEPRVSIFGADRASVQLHGSVGNRQPQSDATARALAGLADAIKRFKNMFQFCVGDTGAVVTHTEDSSIKSPG